MVGGLAVFCGWEFSDPASVAFNHFRVKHNQGIECNNDVWADWIAREDRPPSRSICSREHIHVDRIEDLTA